jgi:hypothetical protein
MLNNSAQIGGSGDSGFLGSHDRGYLNIKTPSSSRWYPLQVSRQYPAMDWLYGVTVAQVASVERR